MRIPSVVHGRLVSQTLQLQLPCLLKTMVPAPAFSTELLRMRKTISLSFLGPSCTLCPANWQWLIHFNAEEVMGRSQQFCSSQNSTLLILKDREKLLQSLSQLVLFCLLAIFSDASLPNINCILVTAALLPQYPQSVEQGSVQCLYQSLDK